MAEQSNLNRFIKDIQSYYSNKINSMKKQQFYAIAGEIIVSDIQENIFDKLGSGDSVRTWKGETVNWPDLAKSTIKQRMRGSKGERKSWPPPLGLVLQRTGDLRASVFYTAKETGVEVSFSQDYGKYLHERFPFMFLSRTALENIQKAYILWAGKQMG